MASVARQLFGPSPSFLAPLPRSRTLPELLSVFRRFGAGQRVVPARWTADGHLASYFTVSRVKYEKGSFKTGTVYGTKTWNGIENSIIQEIPDASTSKWAIWEPKSIDSQILMKYGLLHSTLRGISI